MLSLISNVVCSLCSLLLSGVLYTRVCVCVSPTVSFRRISPLGIQYCNQNTLTRSTSLIQLCFERYFYVLIVTRTYVMIQDCTLCIIISSRILALSGLTSANVSYLHQKCLNLCCFRLILTPLLQHEPGDQHRTPAQPYRII